MLIFVLQFICTRKNEIFILLFVQQKHKHDEMAFLTSRNVSKHVLLALGVNHAARDAVKEKIHRSSDLVSQAMPFTVSCETIESRIASQDVKQMLRSLPLKFGSCSLIAQRY